MQNSNSTNFNIFKVVSTEYKHIIKDVVKNYSLPQSNFKVKEVTTGFVNKTFLLEFGGKAKFVLRESNIDTKLKHIELEVEILNYLANLKYRLTPKVLLNKNSKYITKNKNKFYLLETYLPGTVKASWRDLSKFNLVMLKNFFSLSAEFSKLAEGFKTEVNFTGKPLSFYLTNGLKEYGQIVKNFPDPQGKRLLIKSRPQIESLLVSTKKDFYNLKMDKLSKQLIHFDLHPGNVHFSGNKIVGLFDFDWAGFDSRMVEIAGTISQSCYYFGGSRHGIYRRNRIAAGLKAYRKTYGKSEFSESLENRMIKRR